MFQSLTEATVTVEAPVEEKISKELPVFYNPSMKLNRDLSVLLLRAIDKEDMQVCDLLAGTGIRSVRFLAELPKGKLSAITINDKNELSAKLIKKNLETNKALFKCKPVISITSEEASSLLINSTGFDYIDVDPFGSPNPFLDAACRRIAREGIIAVTATDTSSLAGTFPITCARKYWAKPLLDSNKHETGLRILIRKCQLIAAQYERALVPIFSYAHEHYMRVFFRSEKGKLKCDALLRKHGTFNDAGPMWLGALWDKKLVAKMKKLSKDIDYEFDNKFLNIIAEESKIPCVGFHDIHVLCKKLHRGIPRFELIEAAIKKKGFKASRTHLSPFGIRSDASQKDVLGILRKQKNT
jgi:tRNA (guanine26-N2/guanine27-N2)-dimethyltransferase